MTACSCNTTSVPIISRTQDPQVYNRQPRSQGLSSLPPLVVGTETLVVAVHVTTQNLGGIKICWKGWVLYRPLDQMYLSTHPPCGFGWIDGQVTSRNQGLCSTTKGGRKERPWERGCIIVSAFSMKSYAR